ncbi:FxsA family protein [Kroppenstedtia sanguinis]|uniref:FxsA family protein n=1 Tax=Kroppenstedtia sanguinis TaxID=1380684 RepID=A0ABW4C5M6_9BACL
MLILFMIIVPAVEIWGLVTAGKWIGATPTVLLVIATGLAGWYFARRQGLQTLRLAQIQLSQNELPGDALLDGICILAGGLLLVVPGFFTDILGILLLIPYVRGMVKLLLQRKLMQWMNEGRIRWYLRR